MSLRLANISIFSKFNPVKMAQSTRGYIMAAILVGIWQFAHTTQAAIDLSAGSSDTQYFRLEWQYDLQAGTGKLFFIRDEDLDLAYEGLFLDAFFDTFSVELSNFTLNGQVKDYEVVVYPPANPNDLMRRTYHVGDVGQPGPDDTPQWCIPLDTTQILEFEFPTENITLVETNFSYFLGLSGYLPIPWEERLHGGPGVLDFVSVQQIPEPSTGLFAALAGVIAFIRRR